MSRIIFLLVGVMLFSCSTADDTLTPGRPLTDDGEASLISAGGKFQLGFFSPAGSSNRYVGIWFRNISVDSVVWIANRRRPIAGTSGSLSLTANGTLLIADGNGTVYWTSSTEIAVANPSVQLLDDANLVVREAGGDRNSYPAWQSHDFPTNIYLAGMKIGWNLTSGLNRRLTSWTSVTDPAPGNYTYGIEKQGNAQEVVWQGTQPHWRSGPWNGLYFSGVPGTVAESLVRYEFVVDEQEVVTWFAVEDPSVISRQVLAPDGRMRGEVWMEETQTWSVRSYVPNDPCDVFSACGPNAVCYPNIWPMCQCLPGFRPRNPRNWDVIGDPSDGCVRTTALDCQNGTDGFFQQSSVKLPDTTASAVNRSMSLEDCRSWCLGICSCTAYASANLSTGSESGCMIWTSGLADIKFFYGSSSAQPLHVRLAAADLAAVTEPMESGQRRVRTIIITISCVAALCLLCVASCVWAAKKKKSKCQPISTHLRFCNLTYRFISGVLFFAEHRSNEEVEEENLDLPLFDLRTIAEATGNFCIDNKLGEGGFGPVYKGKLKEGQEIAVKTLSKMSTQGTDEFKNEVMVIAKLQHRNLVRLLGCCIQGGERMLIYEYMLNGSLDTFLFDKDRCRLLDWRMRYNIILGIVRGLLYLHHDSRYRIIHRDLKTSNILLDKDMNPKISDFGMAKLFGGDETTGNTKRVAGTYGYMSPEYAMNGIFSVKSDVFSFGVLMLEIITGKKNNGAYQSVHHQNLLGEIWSLWKENRVAEIVDDSIHHSCPFDEVLTCIKVGLLCVQERSEDRPIMSVVLQMMLGSNSSLLPEPKQPGFVVTGNQNDNDSSGALLSINRLSVTILEGRLFSFSIAGDRLTPAQPLLDDDGSGNLVSGGRFELRIIHAIMSRIHLPSSRFALLIIHGVIPSSVPCSTAEGTLTPGRPLTDDGEASLISAGGKFQLGFFTSTGSSNRYVGIWFRNISVESVVWIANRRRPIAGTSGSLSLTANGTLLIADGNGTVYWTSSTEVAVANPSVQLLDDANLVVREAGGDRNSYPVWQSHDFPTNMHLPGMKIGWNLTSGLNRQLTAWTSATDPAPGNYTFGVEKQGNAQVFVWQGTQPRWRSGPWNGLYFSGHPRIGLESLVRYEFAVDEQEVAAWFAVNNPSVIVRAVLMPDGLLRSEVWMEETQTWSGWVSAPMDPCDVFSRCGPNAVCYPNAWPMCRCLPGFRPRNPRNWEVNGNPTDGCVRKTPLDCRNATDGFFQQSSVKLPDTTASAVNRSMSLEDCRSWCLGSCSCTAYASANLSTGSESGCMIWTSGLADIKFYGSSPAQPLHVRLAAADLAAVTEPMESGQRRMRTIIITISCVAALFLLCVASCVWAAKKKKSKCQPISTHLGFCNLTYRFISGVLFFAEHRSNEEVEEENLDLPLFDLRTIAEATGNFCIDNKLGEGGFGPVYKGKLKEGQEIAVKTLSKMSTQGTDEFKNEVMVIAKLQHRNLVRLLGCCIQGGERMLIYEYMLNGSLDTFLFDKDRCRLLDWRMRYNIILGIVRGLLYLHHDSRYRIIHRDLKTSNILLDKDMNPKISDFGMAKLFGGDETTGNTKRVAGTYGYMSPEYAMNGIFSVKSDVFSFGVLMLEIISGKQNNGTYQSIHHQNLLGEIWSLWKENRVSEIVDDSIHHSCPFDEVLTCIKVGLLCVQERSEDRPIMSAVVQMLLGSNSSLLLEPKQPGFVVTGNQNDNDSSGALLSINRLSVTILEGR
ncbi:LOW QUALITY PROTEIN: uncharacterized protein LOC141845906 [Curcuma longa]|uniref:LOW QUALITY PROTEIN: uncharacterized protein LOC141845906 n=1 Tax=Curcuma longa TaxID=136217 RepID=UPI003D9ECFD2